MEMRPVPEQDPIQAIAEVSAHVQEHQREIAELQDYVLGPKGDIQKGLIWMSTMQGKIILDLQQFLAVQATTVERQREAIEKHAEDTVIHAQRGTTAWNWNRLLYGIAQTATAQLVVLLVLAVLGVMIFGLQAKHILGPGPS